MPPESLFLGESSTKSDVYVISRPYNGDGTMISNKIIKFTWKHQSVSVKKVKNFELKLIYLEELLQVLQICNSLVN